MKISVSSYSYQRLIAAGVLDYLSVMDKAREMGFSAIEYLDMPGSCYDEQLAYAKKLKAHADETGMTINAYTIGACLYRGSEEADKAEVERLKGQVEIAAALGCPVMRHDAVYGLGKQGNARSFGLMLPTLAKNIREVTEYAAGLGVKTCVENHGYIAQDSYRVEQLFNAVGHDNFGLLVDCGNFVCADEDNVTAVSRVAPYAVHVHAKDMYKSNTPLPGYGSTRACHYFKGAIIGEGDVNVEQCLKILHNAGYDGYCSIEFEGSEDCIYGIQTGLMNLRGMLSRL